MTQSTHTADKQQGMLGGVAGVQCGWVCPQGKHKSPVLQGYRFTLSSTCILSRTTPACKNPPPHLAHHHSRHSWMLQQLLEQSNPAAASGKAQHPPPRLTSRTTTAFMAGCCSSSWPNRKAASLASLREGSPNLLTSADSSACFADSSSAGVLGRVGGEGRGGQFLALLRIGGTGW